MAAALSMCMEEMSQKLWSERVERFNEPGIEKEFHSALVEEVYGSRDVLFIFDARYSFLVEELTSIVVCFHTI